jgi:hypothetical protein
MPHIPLHYDPCHHSMAYPQVADGGVVSNMEGSWEHMVQSDKKVSVHLTITIQKVTSNVQSVPCQSSDI